MKIVVDTNIIFSALLKSNSSIADILLNPQNDLDFYAPELLRAELRFYTDKIRKFSRLSDVQLAIAHDKIISRITFVSENLLNPENWAKAYTLTKDVDEDDTPFVALSIELQASLWTGDLKLINGIKSKIEKDNFTVSTSELLGLLNA